MPPYSSCFTVMNDNSGLVVYREFSEFIEYNGFGMQEGEVLGRTGWLPEAIIFHSLFGEEHKAWLINQDVEFAQISPWKLFVFRNQSDAMQFFLTFS